MHEEWVNLALTTKFKGSNKNCISKRGGASMK